MSPDASRPPDVEVEITPIGRFKDWIVPYTDEGVLPKQFRARVEAPGWPVVVILDLVAGGNVDIDAFRGGFPADGKTDAPKRAIRCERITFEPGPDTNDGLMAKNIRDVPMMSVVAWAVAEALMPVDRLPKGFRIGRQGTAPAAERVHADRRFTRDGTPGRPPVSEEQTKRVVQLSAQAEDEGWNNAAHRIARMVGLGVSTVQKIRKVEREKQQQVRRPRRKKKNGR